MAHKNAHEMDLEAALMSFGRPAIEVDAPPPEADDEEEQHGCGDAEEADDLIVLFDEAGNENRFTFLEVHQVNGLDYAILTPEILEDESDDDDACAEIFIYRYEVDEDGDECFTDIDDPEEYAAVSEAVEHELRTMDDALDGEAPNET